ncbi:sugar ABC transporter substrate-binding protein [Cytobacillus sp. FJAT-53684]|uniref:Sugar ABC transporter substrate-binding protein n=1 Tax=Cytobacillus mangrovibacter TaxID=3299024 RepID=A0ABW6K551_9BACI
MVKRSKYITIISFILIFLLSGCSVFSSSAPTKKEQSNNQGKTEENKTSNSENGNNGPITIGVSTLALSNINNQKDYEYTQKFIEEKGHKAFMVNANGSSQKQVQDIETLIQAGVDVIIIQAGETDVLKGVVEKANSEGIPVISVLSGWIPGVSTMIAPNDFEVATRLYQYLAAETGFQGKVITLSHNNHVSIRMRRNVQDAILKEYSGIERVANITTGFPGTEQLAYKGVESTLQAHPDVNAIWATFDLEAIGAAKAVKDLGKEGIVIGGVDGEQQAFQSIKEGGPIVVTYVADIEDRSQKAVDAAEKLANGEQVEKYYSNEMIEVTIENVDEFLEN